MSGDHSRFSGDRCQVAAGRFTHSEDQYRIAEDHSGMSEARFHWQATAPDFPETDSAGRGVVSDFRRPMRRGRAPLPIFRLPNQPADDQSTNSDDRSVRSGDRYAVAGGRSRAAGT